MQTLEIIIHFPEQGIRQVAEVPPNAPVGRLVPVLVERLGLAR